MKKELQNQTEVLNKIGKTLVNIGKGLEPKQELRHENIVDEEDEE